MAEDRDSAERKRELSRRELLRRAGVLGISAGALGPLLAACGGDEDSESGATEIQTTSAETTAGDTTVASGTPQQGGVLKYAWNFPPGVTLNPGGSVAAAPNGAIWTMMQIYDQMTELLPGSLDVQPALAESWEISSDQLTYTFTLRQGVLFSNGDPVTAEDVAFSLGRFGDPEVNDEYAFLSAVESVAIDDETHVSVKLKQPQGSFLHNISFFPASIIPKKVVEELGEDGFEQSPVGSGAFMLKSREAGRSLELERNPHYWREGKPYLDGVLFEFVEDDNARILKATSGESHVASPIPFSQAGRIEGQDGITLQVEELAAVGVININNKVKPLDEINVRLALNYALPREAIRDTVFGGKVDLANNHISRMLYWDKAVMSYPFDIEKAKELIANSSVPDGFEIEYSFIGRDVEGKQIAQIIKDAWSKIGVNAQLKQLDIGTFFDLRSKSEFQITSSYADEFTSDIAADDELAIILYGGPASGFNAGQSAYDDPKATALLREATDTTDEAVRKAKFSELQHYAIEVNPPWTPYAFIPQRSAVREEVQDFQTLPTGWWRLEDVWLKQS